MLSDDAVEDICRIAVCLGGTLWSHKCRNTFKSHTVICNILNCVTIWDINSQLVITFHAACTILCKLLAFFYGINPAKLLGPLYFFKKPRINSGDHQKSAEALKLD